MTRIFIRSLIALLLLAPLIGCLGSDSGEESGTALKLVPYDPDTYSCSPLGDEDEDYLSSFYGVHGQLYYLTPSQPRYTNVFDYFANGTHVSDLDIFLSQIYIPTRPFDRGFVTASGTTIQTLEGDTLYEYFALKLRGRLNRGYLDPGRYQLALLSDDGAVLQMDFGQGFETVVDNNGQHPTRMACEFTGVELGETPIPYELFYNQGPRYHIALTWMVRPWPTDPNDPQCGREGNDRFFDSAQDPPAPTATYQGLLDRGWMPLRRDNFLLPEDKIQNPCNIPAPVISNFTVQTISSTSALFSWTTDIASTSQIAFRAGSDTVFYATPEIQEGRTSHQVEVTGLTPNTNYVFKAVSRSASGQLSESPELVARTRR